MTASIKDDKNRIQSYQRMRDVLKCFSMGRRRLTIAQISEVTALPRPTVHRILGALKEIGFIEQDHKGSDYMLGIGLIELGTLSLSNMDIHRQAQPFLDELARQSGSSAHLGVFNGETVIVVERESFEEPRRKLQSRIEEAPIYCTGVGKAVGAYLPKEITRRILKGGMRLYTTNTIATIELLEREYAQIRARGYSLDNEELTPFVRCVAAPIRNSSGRVLASISLSGYSDRMTPDRQLELSSVVLNAATAISFQLGYIGPSIVMNPSAPTSRWRREK